MLRLAMIGCGQISDRFFKQAAGGDARFVAACARTLDSARRKAAQYGVDAAYDDYETMLDQVRPDGVVIATPHSLHAAPAIAALQRGIHVLNEKPMATSLADCHRMVETADQSGALLMCLPFDHTPAFLTALRFLNEETLGKWTGAVSELLIPGPPRDNWYYDRSIAHGGAVLDCLVYPVSRLVSMFGPASRVTGMLNTLIPHRIVGEGKRVESDVDDNVALTIEWASGQIAVARTLWGTSFSRNDTVIYGRKGTLWLSGGQVVVHLPGGSIGEGSATEWQGLGGCYRISPPADIPNESILEHFVSSILTATQPRCNGRLQLHVHEILFAGILSGQAGRTIPLETRFEPWHTLPASFRDTKAGFI